MFPRPPCWHYKWKKLKLYPISMGLYQQVKAPHKMKIVILKYNNNFKRGGEGEGKLPWVSHKSIHLRAQMGIDFQSILCQLLLLPDRSRWLGRLKVLFWFLQIVSSLLLQRAEPVMFSWELPQSPTQQCCSWQVLEGLAHTSLLAQVFSTVASLGLCVALSPHFLKIRRRHIRASLIYLMWLLFSPRLIFLKW